MNWIPVIQVPLEQDLSELSRYLRQQGVVHRITEERDCQQLWVEDPSLAEPLKGLTERWIAGELELSVNRDHGASSRTRQEPGVAQFPATVVLLVLSILGGLVGMEIAGAGLLPWLTFQPVELTLRGINFTPWSEAMARGELWRLLTPAFLHFSTLHLVFNGLWLWVLGRNLEMLMGAPRYLAFVVVTAIAANFAQFVIGTSLFGGMSGVVYALIGYIWMRQKFNPHPLLAVPPGIIGFMLVWLVLGVTGLIDQFMQGSVANGAHVGGLLAGMAWAILGSYGGSARQV